MPTTRLAIWPIGIYDNGFYSCNYPKRVHIYVNSEPVLHSVLSLLIPLRRFTSSMRKRWQLAKIAIGGRTRYLISSRDASTDVLQTAYKVDVNNVFRMTNAEIASVKHTNNHIQCSNTNLCVRYSPRPVDHDATLK